MDWRNACNQQFGRCSSLAAGAKQLNPNGVVKTTSSPAVSGNPWDTTMTERINADFSRSAIIRTNGMEWRPSPARGVWRKRLELVGEAEAGRVTSIVRFDPGARFPDHGHPGGEEIFVMEGVFSDETGDYPAGSYLLNPEGTSHTPWSARGCTLFVKLRQYPGTGRTGTVIDTRSAEWRPGHAKGTEVLPLQADPAPGGGIARLIRMAPGYAGGRRLIPAVSRCS